MRKNRLLMAVVLVLGIFSSCTSEAQKTNLKVAEFEAAIAQKNIQVLDVRTAEEYKTGHLPNAFLADWNNEAQFAERTKSLDKSKPVYAYCLSGVRSDAAAAWLRKKGFTAYNLSGGINAWNRADKPLQVEEKVKQLTQEEYLSSIPADKTVLVDFGAVWCPPCKKMEPVLEELIQEYGSKFIFIKIDGGVQTELIKAMNIEALPTFIIYKNGKPVWRKTGIVEKNELVTEIEQKI